MDTQKAQNGIYRFTETDVIQSLWEHYEVKTRAGRFLQEDLLPFYWTSIPTVPGCGRGVPMGVPASCTGVLGGERRPLPPLRQAPRRARTPALCALLFGCTHASKLPKKQQVCIQLCKWYKGKGRLGDLENFLSSASPHDCCPTRRVLLLIHESASLQLFHCILSNDQMTNLQEIKVTPRLTRWERPLDDKSIQFFTSGKLTTLEQAIYLLCWIQSAEEQKPMPRVSHGS